MKIKEIIHELKRHSPFTAIATITAIVIVVIISWFGLFSLPESLFNGFHYLHILVSAIATATVFYAYKKNAFQGIAVGILGAIIIGSISDIFFPYLGSLIFNLSPDFHLPILEHTLTVLSFALVGGILGISLKKSRMPHFIHVFLSVFASFFYLINYSYNGPEIWILEIFIMFIITFVSVILFCCVSDIVFPYLFLGEKIKRRKCKD